MSFLCCGCDLSVHVFWTYELHPTLHRCMPKIVDGHIIPFMEGPFNHLRFVTYCLLPFVVIMILNILIVARLRWTPLALKTGFAGSNPAVSLAGLEASSVAMVTREGGANSSTRITNAATSAASTGALRQRQQARPSLTRYLDDIRATKYICKKLTSLKFIVRMM